MNLQDYARVDVLALASNSMIIFEFVGKSIYKKAIGAQHDRYPDF
jgi:hypothetical protein